MDFPIDIGNYVNLKLNGKEKLSKSELEVLSKNIDLVRDAVIAANSYNPNMKYWEIAASGCLTFMEITKKNRGQFLGYEDGKHAIFINEENYKEKFQEYLDDTENSRWKKIAEAGRDYTIKNFNNDAAVSSLVKLIKSLCV